VAKNDATHLKLSEQFAGRQVVKIYEAIVCGRMPRVEGEINASIARHPERRQRMAVARSGGREARTSYGVLDQWKDAARVELRIHTGRTHQIRVHLEHLGCPVLGDSVYGKRQNAYLREATGYVAPRQLLHAGKLSLIHPRSRKRMTFEAELPEDFAFAIEFFDIQESAS